MPTNVAQSSCTSSLRRLTSSHAWILHRRCTLASGWERSQRSKESLDGHLCSSHHGLPSAFMGGFNETRDHVPCVVVDPQCYVGPLFRQRIAPWIPTGGQWGFILGLFKGPFICSWSHRFHGSSMCVLILYYHPLKQTYLYLPRDQIRCKRVI